MCDDFSLGLFEINMSGGNQYTFVQVIHEKQFNVESRGAKDIFLQNFRRNLTDFILCNLKLFRSTHYLPYMLVKTLDVYQFLSLKTIYEELGVFHLQMGNTFSGTFGYRNIQHTT